MKRLKNFSGSKSGSGTYQQIINIMPPHEIYFELFLGNASILLKKKLARFNFGADLDLKVIDHYKEYFQLFDNVILINMDTISFLENSSWLINWLNYHFRILIYLDPPYLFETRKNKTKKIYRCELKREDHIRLLNAVNRLRCYVVISHYQNDLYDSLLNSWNRIEFTAQTRSGTAIESLYFNYDQPEKLHDYNFVGNDFRERDRFRQIKNRLIEKFENMPELEKNFLLQSLSENFNL